MSLMSCDFDKVPTEVLINKFFTLYKHHQKRLVPYINCFKSKELHVDRCQKYIREHCESRFGDNIQKQLYCFRMLRYFPSSAENDERSLDFESYQKCMIDQRKILNMCIPDMYTACQKSKIRVVKTVRLSMHTAEYMLQRIPNFRIIHLIRDPRAVALSRRLDPSFRGIFSGKDLSKEAELYCSNVIHDIKIRSQLEELFPNCCLQVIFDELAQKPFKGIDRIYSFLNETIPPGVKDWLVLNTQGEIRDSKAVVKKWRKQLPMKEVKKINIACREFFELVNYPWPMLQENKDKD